MIPKEIFKKIRQIEITTNRMVTDMFAGQYHSVFKGQGMEFDEVREYNHGDDIRFIDWNVTARTGKPHIKKFVEERELSVMILVDASESCRFGTVNQLKSNMAAEIAAVLAFAAIRNNDKVGLIIFTDRIEKFIPPRKGSSHVLRVVREILYFIPEGKTTDIKLALEYLNKVTNRKSVSFVLSDFFDLEEDIKKILSVTNRKHDLVAITLNDPKEKSLPNLGIMHFEDAETGEPRIVDTGSYEVQQNFKKTSSNLLKKRESMFRTIGIDHIDVSTDVPYEKELIKFFKTRRKRLSRGSI